MTHHIIIQVTIIIGILGRFQCSLITIGKEEAHCLHTRYKISTFEIETNKER